MNKNCDALKLYRKFINSAQEFKETSKLPFEVCDIHLREEGKTDILLSNVQQFAVS